MILTYSLLYQNFAEYCNGFNGFLVTINIAVAFSMFDCSVSAFIFILGSVI